MTNKPHLVLMFAVFCSFFSSTCFICIPAPTMNCTPVNPICETITDNCNYIELDEASEIKYSSKDLLILQLNIRGLLSKTTQLKDTLLKFSEAPDVLLLCETWLRSETEHKFQLPGYKCYHSHKKSKLGGGVSILVKNTLRSRIRNDLTITTSTFEHVAELKTNQHNILLVSCYRPPNSNTKTSLTEYRELVRSLKMNKHHEIIIGLDHNYDLLKNAKNLSTTQFLNLNIDSDLTPVITKPTRVTNKSATLIDNIIISNKLHYNYTPYVIIEDLSDHYPCLINLHDVNKCRKDKIKISKRDHSDPKIEQLNHKLMTIDWGHLETLNANESFNNFHQTLTNTIDEICPKREYHVRHDKLIRDPWITKGISNSLKKQKHLYKAQLGSNDPVSTNRYKSYRNTLKRLIRHSRLSYFHNKCHEFRGSSRELWQLINQITGKGKPKRHAVECLKIDNLLKYNPNNITNGFCKHFANIGKLYAERLTKLNVLVETYIDKIGKSEKCMFMYPTDIKEVKSLITLLPSKTNSGFDDISNILLKK